MENKEKIDKLTNSLNPLPKSLPIIELLAQKQRNRKRTSFPSLLRFAKLQHVEISHPELEKFFLQFQNAGMGKVEYVRNKAKHFTWDYSRQSVIDAVSRSGGSLRPQRVSRVKLPIFTPGKASAVIKNEDTAPRMVGAISKKDGAVVVRSGDTMTVRRGDIEMTIPLDLKVLHMLLFEKSA